MNQKSLDPNSPLPLYYQLKDLLKHKIYLSSWKPDQMIPSEAALSAAYNVSVGTVKKAIFELVNEGILCRRRGKGTFVARPNFDRSFIRFFRFALDEEGERIVPTSRVISSEVSLPSGQVRNVLRLGENEHIIVIKRIRMVRDIPLVLEDLHLPLRLFPGFEKMDIAEKLLYPIFEEKYNVPIIWADEFLEPKIATEQQAHYLGIEKGDPVIFIERIAYTYGEKPVEFRSGVGRGDGFRYHIEIR
jgi:GntR family transcriptional regulator